MVHNASDKIICIADLCKTYTSGKNTVQALNGVNLEIKRGEMVAIVGASGSGKSTLLNILGMLDEPTEGRYILDGKDISGLSDSAKATLRNNMIGFVVQDFALIETYTVSQNIELPLIYAKPRVARTQRELRIDEVLNSLGISDKKNEQVCNLSGGQRQRVAIGRALVNEAPVILADEPTGALDSKTASEIMNILKKLNKQGTTIIMVTHNPQIAECCDVVYKMKDGIIAKCSGAFLNC